MIALGMAQTREAPGTLTLEHVLVMFRHGDRSPITRAVGQHLAMSADEMQFWVTRLADYSQLQHLSAGTRVVMQEREPVDGRHERHDEGPPSPRHGGRWPCGQLTAKGVREMTENGQRLRQQYSGFLTGVDPAREIYVHSTNIRRTLRSAQCILSGMFPTHFDSCNMEKHDREEILIHVDAQDSLGPSHPYELFQSLDELLADDLKHRAPRGMRETSRRVREIVGITKESHVPWSAVREVLVARREHGVAVPVGLDDELFQRVHQLDAWLWYTLYGKRNFCFRSFHYGVQRFLDRVTVIDQKKTTDKMTLFSAHDNSLVALLCALQIESTEALPPYGAMLSFEFYRDTVTQQLFVRASFAGHDVTFKGHSHDVLFPVSHLQALARDFLNQRAAP